MSYFPHAIVRPSQQELIKDMQSAFAQKEILIAHAPTGLGKTASALSVALTYAREHKKKIFFLTNRHTQHKIAIDTLRDVNKMHDEHFLAADLVGKRWMCNQDVAQLFGTDFNEYCKTVVEKGECGFYEAVRSKKGVSVEAKRFLSQLSGHGPLHNEELITLSNAQNMCSYEMALLLAKKADVFIGDYYYIFNPFVQSTLFSKLNIELEDVILIVDEAHNLPGRVTDMLSSVLSTYMIKNGIQEAKKYRYNGLIEWLSELNSVMVNLAKFEGYNKEKKITKSELLGALKTVSYDTFIDELEIAADEVRKKQRRSYLGGIAGFLDAWRGDDEGFARYISERESKYGPMITLHYSCLDPGFVTKDIFSTIFAGVCMSGTLKPTFMYKDVLGIEKASCQEYPSPFPAENKLSLVVPFTSTKFTVRSDSMYQKIARHCEEMITRIPGNVVLFFPSYKLRDMVCHYINTTKTKIWEKTALSKQEKEDMLEEFKNARHDGGVLFGVTGANFAEGIDLPGDLLSGVIIIGLPLARPDIKTKEIISYYDTKFGRGWDYGYTYPAMSKCIQSAGRCIRSETDTGVVVYLDERFSWSRYFSCLPSEGLRVVKEYIPMIEKFFVEKAT